MNINMEHPLIRLAMPKQEFNYERLFTTVFEEYLAEYKNTRYDNLIDKDKSIALARVIKKLEVNSVPVQEFFKDELEAWSEKHDNFSKILKLVNLMARDMFCCFDPNLTSPDGEFKRCNRIYAVNNDGIKDYVAVMEPEKKGLFASRKKPNPYVAYFAELIRKDQEGLLPKSKAEEAVAATHP